MRRSDAKHELQLPILRTQLVPIFLRRAHVLGLDVSDVCARFEIPREAAHDAEVSIGLAAFHAFAAEIAERAGDELYGFHAALEARRGDFGTLEYVLRNAPTVRAALERLAQYGRSINAQVRVTFDPAAGRLSEAIPGSPMCLGRHGNDFAVAHKIKFARELLGTKFVPTRVFLAHPPPVKLHCAREQRAHFRGSELIYHAEANGFEVAPTLLSTPLEHADAALLLLLEKRLGEVAAATEPTDSVELLRRAVAEDLAAAEVTGERLAARLGLSTRTLHRRLAAAGVSVRLLVDDVRREMATAFLADAELPLDEIGRRLGYSDARAFTRAFVRWTGETPAAYRNRSWPRAP